MSDFFLDYFFPGLMVALILAICVFVGAMPASAVAGGQFSVLMWAIFAAAIMGAFGAFVGSAFFDMVNWSEPRTGAIIMGTLAVICTMALPTYVLITGHETAAYLREMAPKVEAFAVAHFDEIDTDDDEIITDGEMEAAFSRISLTGDERDLLAHMRAQQSEIGHVISSYTTTTWIWISTGNGGGFMSPVTTTHYIYGINRTDLTSYEERTVEKYKRW